MIGVKIAVLLIVLTVIWKYVTEILINGESLETKIRISMNSEVTWYMVMFALLIISSVIGLLYSLVYLLFLR